MTPSIARSRLSRCSVAVAALGLCLTMTGPVRTQDMKVQQPEVREPKAQQPKVRGQASTQDPVRGKAQEISDQSLYSEVIFTELFEKDAKKAGRLLEKLLSRKISNPWFRSEVEYRYHRLMLSSGQLERYAAYIDRALQRKDLSPSQRERLQGAKRLFRERGKELRKQIADYKRRLHKAKDAEERVAIREKFLRDIDRYTGRSRSNMRRPDPGSEEGDRRLAKRIGRIQDLHARIETLEKAGKGDSRDAKRLRQELNRVINQKDRPRRDPRGSRRMQVMMQGFYRARQKIEQSGNHKRLKEFEKLRGELRSLLMSGQGDKVRELLKKAEKRFPELKRTRHG